MHCIFVASIAEMKPLQASAEEMEKKYNELENKCSNSLDTQIKMEAELKSKDENLAQYKREVVKAIKKLEDQASKLRSELDAASFNSDILNEELLGKQIFLSCSVKFFSES